MMTTSSNSESAPLAFVAQVVVGTVLIASLAAVVWMVSTRRTAARIDPQAEIDRRISSLEGSLSRLQDVFSTRG